MTDRRAAVRTAPAQQVQAQVIPAMGGMTAPARRALAAGGKGQQDVITRGDGRDAAADLFHNPRALVAQHTGHGARDHARGGAEIRMAYASRDKPDADFVRA